MKKLLLDILVKIRNRINAFMTKAVENIKFESSKSEVIKVMLDSVLEVKSKEKEVILAELKNTSLESEEIKNKINEVQDENKRYREEINAMRDFLDFRHNNR